MENAFIYSSILVGMLLNISWLYVKNQAESSFKPHIKNGTILFCCEAAAQQAVACCSFRILFIHMFTAKIAIIVLIPRTGILAMCFETTFGWL